VVTEKNEVEKKLFNKNVVEMSDAIMALVDDGDVWTRSALRHNLRAAAVDVDDAITRLVEAGKLHEEHLVALGERQYSRWPWRAKTAQAARQAVSA
jgi:hypothetical protein